MIKLLNSILKIHTNITIHRLLKKMNFHDLVYDLKTKNFLNNHFKLVLDERKIV